MTEKVFYLSRDMLDNTFAELVAPDREKLLTCIQCGTCTASCPTAYAMDYTPRQLWRLIQLGLREEVLTSNSFWLCTACYACTLRCLRGIACTETMSTLKRMAVSMGMEKHSASARFYEAFRDTVRRHGRLHEVELMTTFSVEPSRDYSCLDMPDWVSPSGAKERSPWVRPLQMSRDWIKSKLSTGR